MAKNLSGRVKKTPPTGVSADRYNYIGLSEVEPDLGVPSTTNQVLTSSVQGIRSWVAATALQGTGGSAGIQGLTGIQGIQGTVGASGVSSSYFNYRIDTNSTANTDPGAGNLRYNNVTQTSATALYIDYLTQDNIDIDMFLALLQVNDKLFIQDANNSDNVQQFKVSGAINPGNNTYVQVPVTYVTSSGTGTTNFANNHPVILVTTAAGIQGTTGSQGVTGTQGTAGTQGLTGNQGTVGTTGTQGLQGSQGTTGTQGTTGLQGLQGIQGITGRYTLSANAPSSPVVGDAWVDTDDGRTYIYDATGWFEPYDNLIGLQGTQGIQGTFGPATVPLNSQTSSYTLAASDNGKLISITTGGVTVPVNIFSTGNNIVIYNNSTSSQTITQGTNTTLRLSGTASTGNRTLSQYGIATVICVDATNNANVFTISGAGLS